MTAPTPYQVGPFDSAHQYVQWGGLLPGEEQWSCGFRMWKAGGAPTTDSPQLLITIGAAIAAYHARATTKISPNAKLQFVKVNAIGTDGRYVSQDTNEATYANVAGGGTLQFSPANQIALAVSLTTGFDRGPAHRGRFYLPIPCIGIGTDGRMFESDVLPVKTSTTQLLTDVNANGAGYEMVVMSRKAGAAGHRAVTGIQLGRVLDTQRRRRRSLLEAYV